MSEDPVDGRIINRWGRGLGWIAYPNERMERASQAIVGESGVWLIDPLEMSGLGAILESVGEVVGIVLTLGRHKRDAESLASRYGVPIHLPAGLSSLADTLDARTRSVEPFPADTGFDPVSVLVKPGWREYALYDADGGTVYISEAVGTASYFKAPQERLGVHPVLRLWPPRSALGHVTADHILVGHGEGIMRDGTAALQDALAGARKRAPRAYLTAFRGG